MAIWTHSLSTLQALSSKNSRSKTVMQCHKALLYELVNCKTQHSSERVILERIRLLHMQVI